MVIALVTTWPDVARYAIFAVCGVAYLVFLYFSFFRGDER